MAFVLTIAGVEKSLQPGWSLERAANGRKVFTFMVLSLDGSYRPPVDAEVVLTRDATVEFGGVVQRPTESGLGGYAVTPIETHITAVDFNSLADRRYVTETISSRTLKAVLEVILPYLEGVTLDPAQVDGPTLPALAYSYAKTVDVLNDLTVQSGGFLWEISGTKVLRMFMPGSEAAPFDITVASGKAVGDIVVEPTRNGYANRIIVRYSDLPRTAYGYLTASANVQHGDTVTVGGKTYTFRLVLTDVANYVALGATYVESLQNLVAAIMLSTGAGTAYAASTTVNTQVTATVGLYRTHVVYDTIRVQAITPGNVGNAIAVAATGGRVLWFDEADDAMTTLLYGSDVALGRVSIANDAAEQLAHGIWEALYDSPETTTLNGSDALAGLILARSIVTLKTVTYPTDTWGLQPGQTQTITIPTRNLSGTYLLTAVRSRELRNGHVRHDVTALEGIVWQNGGWRETWRSLFSGGAVGRGASVGASGSTTTRYAYFLGGSGVDAVQSPTPTWVPASGGQAIGQGAIQVQLNTVPRGTQAATVTVRMKALDAGVGVTARLYDVTAAAACDGVSAEVVSTDWVTVTFAVTLAVGSHLYELQVLAGAANSDVMATGYVE
jgi:hypothetical protein